MKNIKEMMVGKLVEELGYDVESAKQHVEDWATENREKINGKTHDIVWYMEECDNPVEMAYSLTDDRWLTDEELEQLGN